MSIDCHHLLEQKKIFKLAGGFWNQIGSSWYFGIYKLKKTVKDRKKTHIVKVIHSSEFKNTQYFSKKHGIIYTNPFFDITTFVFS